MKQAEEMDLADWERYFQECQFVTANYDRYLDENLDPILDSNGAQIFEVEVLSKVSEKARALGRDMFSATIRAVKSKRHGTGQ